MVEKKKLVVLSGPSCVGKGPLRQALHVENNNLILAEVFYTAGEDDKSEWPDPLGSELQRVLNEFVAVPKGGVSHEKV